MCSRLLPAILCCAVLNACTSTAPTAPSCVDQYGRGESALTILQVTCAPSGSDMTCTAIARTSGLYDYCPKQQVVTFDASWASSDPAVAVFSSPGNLKVLAEGQVQVTAKWSYLSGSTLTYFVAPGFPPRLRVDFSVSVTDALTRAALAGAVVTTELLDGPTQSCVSDDTGTCRSAWVTPLSGIFMVSVMKSGYESKTQSVAVYSSSMGLSVALNPLVSRSTAIEAPPYPRLN